MKLLQKIHKFSAFKADIVFKKVIIFYSSWLKNVKMVVIILPNIFVDFF